MYMRFNKNKINIFSLILNFSQQHASDKKNIYYKRMDEVGSSIEFNIILQNLTTKLKTYKMTG